MKKLIFSLVLLLGLVSDISYNALAQTFIQQVVTRRTSNFSTAVAGTAFDFHGLGYGTYQVKYEVFNGTLSACSLQLEGSADNVNFNLVHGPITCTSDGITVTVTAGSGSTYSSYMRVNVTTLTKSSANAQLNTTILAYQ